MTALIPINISFVSWCNELRNSFPSQDIPIITSENQWRSFNNMLQSNRCFEDKFLPDIGGYDNWREWASEFMLSIGA